VRLFYNVARRSGLDESSAQDIVQETVISVARRIPGFQYDPERGSFKQWLLRITLQTQESPFQSARSHERGYSPNP
jgi:DNA-directed RNA polymerase specialized sigma24 family protein